MATATKPISAKDAAKVVLAEIRHLLPQDARWNVEYFDEDGMYLLNVFTDEVDRMALHKAAGMVLTDLALNRGLSMALVPDSLLTLRVFPTLKTQPVHKRTSASS